MRNRLYLCLSLAFVLFHAPLALAQDKLLTIDDIFDPAKRVNFAGTPANPRWLKDGAHYIVRRATRHTSEDIHQALFARPPKPKSLPELKAGIKRRIKQKHARG